MKKSNYISINPNVTIRREYFGCLSFNSLNGQYRQFNKDAYSIFSMLNRGVILADLMNLLKAQGFTLSIEALASFLSVGVADGLLQLTETLDDNVGSLFDYNETELQCTHLAAPSSCTLYVTERCTKSCLHCVVRSDPTPREELSTDQFVYILEQLRRMGVFSVIITGGEPLLRPDIADVLNAANNLGLGISLLTDYDAIDEKHFKLFARLPRLHYIQTSLDGAAASSHDFIRGKGAFKKTLRRLQLLAEHNIQYTISVAVSKRNLHELDAIVDLYHKYKARYLYLNPLAPYGRAKRISDLVLDTEELRFLSWKYYDLIKTKKVNSGNAYWESLKHDDMVDHPNLFEGAIEAMSIGRYNLSIGARGEVHLDSKMKSENLLYLGSALHDDLWNLWQSPKLGPLRATRPINQPALITHSQLEAVLRQAN